MITWTKIWGRATGVDDASFGLMPGKPIKLTGSVTRYAVEFTKDGRNAEIVVDSDGAVIEP